MQFLLSGLYELFPAFGTGDGDLSLTLGNSHLLAAAGTIVIAVILVFDLLEKEEEFAVLFIALVNIPGEGPEDCYDHEGIGNGGKQQLHCRAREEGCQQREGKACNQNGHIQLIRAVTAGHKMRESGAQPIAQVPKPVSKSVHKLLLLALKLSYIIFQILIILLP